MALALAYVGLYAVIVGVASFVETRVGRGLSAFQMNVLIRVGSLAAAIAGVLAIHGLALPAAAYAIAGLGIGLVTGIGSILYCFALKYLPVAIVVTLSSLYLAITILLGIALLHEPITALKLSGLALTLAGELVLGYAPARYGVHDESRAGTRGLSIRGDPEVLDLRPFPPPRRHQLIFSTLDELPPGKSITLVNDHDPKPLRYQLAATRPGAFSWEYVEEGPEVWCVHIARR